MKILVALLAVFWVFNLKAQDLSPLELKRPITEKDHDDLLNLLRKGFSPDGNLQYVITTVTIYPELPENGVRPTVMADLDTILQKIKEDPENIDHLIAAGNIYKALNYPKTADKYFAQALDRIAKKAKITPDDALLYEKAGHVYTGMNNYQMMILSYEKALKLDPARDTIAKYFLPLAYLATGFYMKLDEATSDYLKKDPDDLTMHFYHLFADLYQVMQKGVDYGPKSPEEFYKTYTIFQDVDTSLVNQLLKRYPGDVSVQHLIKAVNMYELILKMYATFDFKTKTFLRSKKDEETINHLIKFHSDLIKKKKTKNLYHDYLSIGILKFMLGDYKSALDNYEKAIAAMPANLISNNFNAVPAYDNIIMLHIFTGDTLKAEKALDKKIADRPGQYKNAFDYYCKGIFGVIKNDMALTREQIALSRSADSSFYKAEILETVVLMHEKNLTGAQQKLEEIYSVAKEEYYYNYVYGILMLMKNDATMAKIFLAKTLGDDGESVDLNRIIDRYFKIP